MKSTTWSGPRKSLLVVIGLTVLFALVVVLAATAPARADGLDQPMLTLGATPTVVNWAQPWALSGELMDSTMAPIPDATVDLKASIDGGDTWATLEGETPAAGTSTYAATVAAPDVKTEYQLVFAGDATHEPAYSNVVTVTPRVQLGTPVVPATVSKGVRFTVYGSLKPQQPKGSKTVKINCYLKQSGKWVLKKSMSATNANKGSGSRYSATFSLSGKGSWKLLAYAPATAKYAKTASGADFVKVK